MDPRAGLDGCRISRFYRDLISGSSSQYRDAIPTELSRPQQYYLVSDVYRGYMFRLKISILKSAPDTFYVKSKYTECNS